LQGIGLSNLIPEIVKNIGINNVFNMGVKAVGITFLTDKATNMRVQTLLNRIKK
jgi:hypothetical protein